VGSLRLAGGIANGRDKSPFSVGEVLKRGAAKIAEKVRGQDLRVLSDSAFLFLIVLGG
jgi:hypothetical protein